MRHDFDKADSSYYKTDKGRTDRQLLCFYNFNNILAVQFTYQLLKLFLVINNLCVCARACVPVCVCTTYEFIENLRKL